jgi:hypothetical protein
VLQYTQSRMTEFDLINGVFDFLLMALPVLLPFGILAVLIDLYIDTNRRAFQASLEHVLLEIIPPQDITKSPAAMELFFIALFQTGGEGNWYDKYVKGQVRPSFSLEMISEEGNVRFFIWTRDKMARVVESQLYSQFPGIEVSRVDDYTLGWEYGEKSELFAVEYKLTQPDPYPIKTYVDYGLDKEQEEEYKIDPITPTIEFLGSLGPGEHAWLQIIIRAHKKEDPQPGTWFGVQDNWKETATSEIQKIREKSLIPAGKDQKQVQTTKGQELRITALERSISKLAFDTGIRAVYIAKKESYQGGSGGAMVGSFKQYGSMDLNSFAPSWTTSFDFPWQDRSGKKIFQLKEEMLEAYKDRSYFGRSYPKFTMFGKKSVERTHFVLNTEELATIYHFPGQVSQTPSLHRVASKKGTPPPNLPV